MMMLICFASMFLRTGGISSFLVCSCFFLISLWRTNKKKDDVVLLQIAADNIHLFIWQHLTWLILTDIVLLLQDFSLCENCCENSFCVLYDSPCKLLIANIESEEKLSCS